MTAAVRAAGGTARPGDVAQHVASSALERGALVLATDFDGTLAPIAATPDQARPLAAGLAALTLLARPGALRVPATVAVITSRSCADIATRIHLGAAATLVGAAGMEVLRGGVIEVDPRALPWRGAVAEASRLVADALDAGRVAGARLERKGWGVVIHTRGLRRPGAESEAIALGAEVASATGLDLVAGKRAIELRPPLHIGKGDALRSILAAAGNSPAVIAAGDDLPDISMLEVARGADGTSVAVADSETPAAVLAAATCRVDGPWAWSEALSELVSRLVRPPA